MKLAVHECVVCRDLPLRPFDEADVEDGIEYRPKNPRPAPYGGPRSRRCFRHEKAKKRREKSLAAAGRSRKRSGLTEVDRQGLLTFQGGVCAGCGRGPGSRAVLSADHDHELARRHNHPEEVACAECLRGFLCARDNRDILGLLYAQPGATTDGVITVLRSLADYLEDPPMRRYRRREVEETA